MLLSYRNKQQKPETKTHTESAQRCSPQELTVILQVVKRSIQDQNSIYELLALYPRDPQASAAKAMFEYFTLPELTPLRQSYNDDQNGVLALEYAERKFNPTEGKNFAKLTFGDISTPRSKFKQTKLLGSSSGSQSFVVQDPLDAILDFIEGPDMPSLDVVIENYNVDPEAQEQARLLFQAVRSEDDEFAFFRGYRVNPNTRRQVAKAHVANRFTCEADVVKNLQAQSALEGLQRGTEYASPKGRGSMSFAEVDTELSETLRADNTSEKLKAKMG